MHGMHGQAKNDLNDRAGSRMGMWLFLASEALFFAAPLILYAAYRYRYPADFRGASLGLSPGLGAFNTAVLLTSSLTMALSVQASGKGNKRLAVLFLAVTMALGALFLFDKYLEWRARIGHGTYPGSGELSRRPRGEVMFYGLYFFLTGLHGLHVAAGMGLLAVMLALSARARDGDGALAAGMENAGLYWHLVDVIWIYLFPLFYLVN